MEKEGLLLLGERHVDGGTGEHERSRLHKNAPMVQLR